MIYSGFWRRALALAIDFLCLVIPVFLMGLVIPAVGGFIVVLLYKPVFESSRLMATPGKVIMGMTVTDQEGLRISFVTAVFRYLLSFLSGALCGLGYFMSLFTEKRQTFHDLLLATVVTDVPAQTGVSYIQVWKEQMQSILKNAQTTSESASQPSVNSKADSKLRSDVQAIEALHKLYQQGALTEQEYTAKKAQILGQL
jgi:uncharacterized RDD family membrane protein YckC